MATPSLLKRLGDKASDITSAVKSLAPGTNEMQSLKAKQDQVNALKPQTEQPETKQPETITTSTVDAVNPLARYGDRGSEKRLKVNIDGSIEPDTSTAGAKPVLKPIPIYDDGGDVDVEDGKHQVAVLQDGEKVLTPEQAAAYDAEHGAPADFGGRVIPNPKGLKPILDTDIKPQADEPVDAKMNTDNAPLIPPKGDTSNPPATNLGGAEPREASTEKKLRPYSEVAAEKEKAEVADKVNNPGVKPIASDTTETEIKPRGGTPQEQKAVDTDIRNAMGKGVDGLTQLGLAKIHDKLLPPAEVNQSAQQTNDIAAPATDQNAGPGLKPIVSPAPAAPAMDHKARIADYDKRIQAALDKATPEGQEEADRLALAKQEFVHSTPWGTPGNHPGILGKLGHVAEHVAARLPVIGQAMEAVPGTEASRNAEHNATLARTQADTPLTTAREAEENAADKVGKTNTKGWLPLPKPVLNPATNKYEEALYNPLDPKQLEFKGEAQVTDKPVTGQANKDAFQKVLAKIGTPEAADPGKQMEAINAAHEAKTITDQEYNDSIGYLGANPAPATQMASSAEKADAAAKAKRAGKWFTWTDDEGTHFGSGDKVPDNSEPTEVDGKTFMSEARSGNIVQKSLNKVAQDVDENPDLFDNSVARNILATALTHIDRSSAGLLIAGTGGSIPLPSGLDEMINTALQNKALDDKTSRAVKNYIADYKSMKDKVIVMQMEMQNGKIGRGSAQAFKAIADQIPNGDTPDSQTAKRQLKNLFETQQDLMGKYPDRYQSFNKEKPYAAAAPVQAPKGATDEVVVGGKVTGHLIPGENGKKKYVPLETAPETEQ